MKNMDQLENLEKQLKLTFTNKDLIKQAFIHRSYLNEAKKPIQSNERLEFLGDSILSYIVSLHLYTNYPQYPEGHLTNLRASLVKTTTLAEISTTLHLGDYLHLSHGEEESGGRKNPSILADTFEALLGAVYLDQGIDAAKQIVDSLILPILPHIMKEKLYKDAKSSFQELVQEETKASPIYKVVKEVGPDHAKEFTIGVFVGTTLWGSGTGRSKQEAEQAAAANALEKWKKKEYNRD